MITGFLRNGFVSPVFNSNSTLYAPSVTGLDTGGFVVTATHVFDGISGQKFDASGNKTGADFRVNTTSAPGSQTDSAVTAFSDGSFVVTWQSILQDGSEWGIYAQRYDAGGARAGAEFRVNSTTLDAQSDPTIASLGNGGFVVVWQSDNQDGSNQGVFGQRFAGDGTAQGAEFQINTATFNKQNDPQVSALDDGGFVVTWTSEDQDGIGKGVYAQRYDSAGQKAGAEFLVNTTTPGNQRDPVVSGLDDGGFVIAWEAETPVASGNQIFNIMGQRYDATGAAVGSEFQVTSAPDQLQTDPSLTRLADGGFVVVWEYFRGAGELSDVYGQRYDAAGARIGDNFEISVAGAVNQDDPNVTALADGGFAVAFHNSASGSNTVQLFKGQLFGTAADDMMDDTIGANWMNGQGGNDTLSGQGGRDRIFGGAGNDTLNGNAGRDRLNGEAGKDVLNGNSGNDRLSGGAGRDVLSGDQGKDTLVGGGGNDRLFGDGGNDTLNGSAGNDRLHGGGGDDRLTGGSGADIFIFKKAKGEGVDRITDFADAGDKVDLSSFNFAGFAAINASQAGTDVRLDLGAGKALVIENMVLNDFDPSDVIL